MRRTFVIVLALLAAAPLAASEIYTWKDARGVTHYSETPPPAGTRFEVRRMAGTTPPSTPSTPATPAPAATPAAATAANANASAGGDAGQCDLARKNVAALKAEGAVQQVGADGKPRELSANERTDQLALSEAAVRAYCR
ncbi:DUF4124 domain-containing protein [Luteimonas terrae]|uniref:DUF4124 domain-containing protein n=1 Tax=Luteimonas terrae TaxID=1530191 RepID=A0A4R5U7H1_9GAMM|nr:DUF4124 domain-containing protein [Luteimonas terrae]TDK30013.1 DUF4124 domain-containing protein [Luteimonas terrae]